MNFGCRLKKIRTEKHISQALLASELGISTNTISQYETNKRFPDQKILVRICIFFDVSSDYLLGLSDIPRPSKTLSKLSLKTVNLNDEQIEALNTLLTVFNI